MDLSHNTKPIMYLFNQPWCGACKRLKETFQQEGDKISKLSQKFILVNVGGDDNSGFGVRLIPVLQQPAAILACFGYQAVQLLYGNMPWVRAETVTLQEAFAPDGGYIPRILFAEPSGTLRPDLKNPANQKEYAYFYDSMDKVRMHVSMHTLSGSPLTFAYHPGCRDTASFSMQSRQVWCR